MGDPLSFFLLVLLDLKLIKFELIFQNSGIEKAFLFDVVSKIYIATDSSPVDMQSYELCCDMIDVVIDISCIYGSVHSLSAVLKFRSMAISRHAQSLPSRVYRYF